MLLSWNTNSLCGRIQKIMWVFKIKQEISEKLCCSTFYRYGSGKITTAILTTLTLRRVCIIALLFCLCVTSVWKELNEEMKKFKRSTPQNALENNVNCSFYYRISFAELTVFMYEACPAFILLEHILLACVTIACFV